MTVQKIIHTLLLSGILLPCFITPAFAAEGIDPRCMTLEDCKTMRAQIGVPDEELADGFMTRADSAEVRRSCPETMFGLEGGEQKEAGLCLPAQAAETKIAIGGKTTFLSLAEYIAYIYRYSMIVAGALCVLLLIIAGIEWTMSGGDGSRIDEAKNRISNAITGLILMATSYVVLYTIDPNLTTLKPPEVYMVRGVGVFDPWCSAIANDNMALGEARNMSQPNTQPTPFKTADFSARPNTAKCGFEYHISASEGQMCKGSYCARSATGAIQTCGQKTSTSTPTCVEGNIVGRIFSSNFWEAIRDETSADRFTITAGRFFLGDGWIWDPASGWIHGSGSGNLALKAVCADGEVIDVDTTNTVTPHETDKSQFYQISVTEAALDQAKNSCTGTNIRGYLTWFDLNELELGDVAASGNWYGRAGAGCVLGVAGGWIGCGVGAVVALAVPLDRVLSTDEEHYIGKKNTEIIDIIDEGGAELTCYLSTIDPNVYLTKQAILNGIQMNVDMNDIADIDDDTADRIKAYGSIYENCWNTAQAEHAQQAITNYENGPRPGYRER